ncbi:MAG: 1,4-alpha-glucan branching protein GlgB [Clostridia bacterium]|nr:1,4-alpha-glucan branching protein GlgB [Clostridia bacterium]
MIQVVSEGGLSRGEPTDEYLFHQGTLYSAYRYLGCRSIVSDGSFFYSFRTWAPRADEVRLLSDFLDWERGYPMKRVTEKGVWELVVKSDESLAGSVYKFLVISSGTAHCKGDPYAFSSKGSDDGGSVVTDESSYVFRDEKWLAYRRKTVAVSPNGHYLSAPVNIYEIHLGSFDRGKNGEYLSYRELADRLVSYVKTMGYTHVELMPIAEYPYDGSWGYQVCAYYAPTSRFGSPDDFRYFVDTMHRAGIGVLLDWVPAHFPKDEWGLYEFDGHPLYEYQGKDRMESRSWGTRFFDLGREEVQSFLISNALYWFREFHIDGLRVDAVASMLYLDYDRLPGEWIPNPDGGNKNPEAVAFLQKLNSVLFSEFPDVLMIAEESTSFAKVTHPVSEGGLGFNLKWNMGWANDFYEYLATDPVFRKYHHHALNFPLMYAFSENYVLPITHDEVVHGKKSLIGKISGSYEDKFRQFRCALLLQMTYPGKKLLFMGCEYAQFSEWDYKRGLEWFMLDYPIHRETREYTASLNRFYLSRPELWEIDFEPKGFSWIDADNAAGNLVSFLRRDAKGEEIEVVISFSGSENRVFLPAKRGENYEILFEACGTGESRPPLKAKKQGDRYVVPLVLPPFSGYVLQKIKKNDKPSPIRYKKID